MIVGSRKKTPGAGATAMLVAAAAALVLLAPGVASARPATSAAFSVRAANGFVLDVASERGQVTLVASERQPPVATFTRSGEPRPASIRNGAASIYHARTATAGPRTIDTRLGRLGRIAVDFRPSGRTRVTRLGPGTGLGCGRSTRIVRRLGTFVGTIEFRGEDGYTWVRTTAAPGSVGTPLPDDCAGSSAVPRGALLNAVDCRSGTTFEARTTSAGIAFEATWEQRLGGGVIVTRRAFAGAPREAFAYGRGLRSAWVSPPAPFSGAARYRATPSGRASWAGSLTATFPGGVVPMAGPRFRAQLGELP